MKYNTKSKIPNFKKTFPIFMMFVLAFLMLIVRLFYVTAINCTFYKLGALKQSTIDVSVSPRRGNILDRNGNILATNINAYRIDIDMNTLRLNLKHKDMTMGTLTNHLSSILNTSSNSIKNILYTKNKNGTPVKYITLARHINKGQADKITALKLQGLIVSNDNKRYYLNGNFLANVLGYTNTEGTGVAGVEESYNNILSGTPGKKVMEKDNKNNELPYKSSVYVPAIDGKNIELTIDEKIQFFAEQAAERALKDNKAKSVTITVMNPKNGEILAMVNKPDYDPNKPSTNLTNATTSIQDLWQNNAVQHSFEPGSIFKVITSYAALAENVVNDSTRFYDPGYVIINGVTINEWNKVGFPTQTFQDIIKNSSNVGFVNVGVNLLGKEKLFKYINLFKFGKKTNIDLPGESPGIVRSVNKVNSVDLATISFGQEISVTAVQYLAAFNSVANGGTWIRPHIMKSITHNDKDNNQVVDNYYNNLGKENILDGTICSKLRTYLRKVVTDGVGSKADVPGLDIAGKTGTAQKSSTSGGYAPEKYMSSFAGMAPAKDPKITILISIDEPDPSNYYAGSTAAPVAKILLKQIFDYLQVNGQSTLAK